MDYDDDYPTCERTRATLRIYPGTHAPEYVTRLLSIRPTSTQCVGDQINKYRECTINGWFLTTEDAVDSLDSRRHIDWLLDKLDNKMHDLDGLRNDGGKIDIACSWYSVSGHGGPTISPKQSMRLANLGIDLWFDVYFFPDDEVANDSSISPEGAA